MHTNMTIDRDCLWSYKIIEKTKKQQLQFAWPAKYGVFQTRPGELSRHKNHLNSRQVSVRDTALMVDRPPRGYNHDRCQAGWTCPWFFFCTLLGTSTYLIQLGSLGIWGNPFPLVGYVFFPGGYLIDDLTSHFISLRLRIVDNAWWQYLIYNYRTFVYKFVIGGDEITDSLQFFRAPSPKNHSQIMWIQEKPGHFKQFFNTKLRFQPLGSPRRQWQHDLTINIGDGPTKILLTNPSREFLSCVIPGVVGI